ncbi:uncharacterized protein PHACADRAFT_259204 [Phanerochaete carnosa HHB-10118-sp]|uniref:Uncharacterized protein n=1 Tax=Phanerochaete carnosa (strain HHB-10118-sp) TaxID=650164 RepID=K5W2A3_PHACS|nr:uncharacterized protein PHACADRAFT_259204 [Phanerochaete carnosa HHB-10118-sp]EKM53029.1 hypothetical protein PHACADRAFT_259204 [Phanerochaete carnosa HHB-10118-sp]
MITRDMPGRPVAAYSGSDDRSIMITPCETAQPCRQLSFDIDLATTWHEGTPSTLRDIRPF